MSLSTVRPSDSALRSSATCTGASSPSRTMRRAPWADIAQVRSLASAGMVGRAGGSTDKSGETFAPPPRPVKCFASRANSPILPPMIRKAPSTASSLASSLIGPVGLALALAGLAVLPACDDSGEQRKDGAPGTPDGKSPDAKAPDAKGPTPSITRFKSPAEAIGAYNKCYSDCFTANTNATNRETCKLDCDSLAETGMDTLKSDAEKTTYETTWKTLRGCITGCWEDRKLNETNRSTCLLTCSDSAEISAVPVPPPPGLVPVPPGTPPTGTPPATGTPPTGTPPAAKPPTPTPPTTGTPGTPPPAVAPKK